MALRQKAEEARGEAPKVAKAKTQAARKKTRRKIEKAIGGGRGA